jgi:phage regulator Rha-like protein
MQKILSIVRNTFMICVINNNFIVMYVEQFDFMGKILQGMIVFTRFEQGNSLLLKNN